MLFFRKLTNFLFLIHAAELIAKLMVLYEESVH